jgi:hypothetical protein
MRYSSLIFVFLSLSWNWAIAQGQQEPLAGTFGSVHDPDTSCAVNPHQITLMSSPPHAFLTWSLPVELADGSRSAEAVFDIVASDLSSLTLRRECQRELTETGEPLYRILRLTPRGYCWGRADWPSVRCEDEQERCNAVAPSS